MHATEDSESGAAAADAAAAWHRRVVTRGRTLREHTARGTIVNAAFLIALSSLGLLKGFIVAAFLTRGDYGIWGILVVGLAGLGWLKGSSVGDKFVQQSEEDQELAFQKAFTIELLLTSCLVALIVAALPVIALAYGQWRVVAPGLLIAFIAVPATAMQTPLWVFYRRMEFVRQRSLQAADPVVGFVVTILLAVAGAGYWSLAAGAAVGAVAGAAMAVRAAPYPLRFRYDRGTLGEYFQFSWPVMIAGVSALVIAQGSLLVPNIVLGLAAVGTVTLAVQVSNYADRVDSVVTSTLYPAICAVKDRTDLLFETFVKSNRLALMWGLPFGVGVAVFAADIVNFGIGERWRPAIGLIRVFGAATAVHQIGFNWTAFYSARAETRPIAVVNIVTMLGFLAFAVPLTVVDGLSGFGLGIIGMTAASLAAKSFYLRRLFHGFRMTRHMIRAVAPTVPAVVATLGLRLVDGSPRTGAAVAAEVAIYVVVTLVATSFFERDLLREVFGYLRTRSAGRAVTGQSEVQAA